MTNTTTKPEPATLLQGKPWVHSSHTDVQKTWRKFGWQPAHPEPTYESKGAQHVVTSPQGK